MKLDARQTPNTERQKPVVVFEHPELALHGPTVPVEGTEVLALTGDVRVLAARRGSRQRLTPPAASTARGLCL